MDEFHRLGLNRPLKLINPLTVKCRCWSQCWHILFTAFPLHITRCFPLFHDNFWHLREQYHTFLHPSHILNLLFFTKHHWHWIWDAIFFNNITLFFSCKHFHWRNKFIFKVTFFTRCFSKLRIKSFGDVRRCSDKPFESIRISSWDTPFNWDNFWSHFIAWAMSPSAIQISKRVW